MTTVGIVVAVASVLLISFVLCVVHLMDELDDDEYNFDDEYWK